MSSIAPAMDAPPRPLIEGPSAWVGKDLRIVDDWIHVLSAEAVEEIDAAVALIEREGRALESLTRDAFVLPKLSRLIAQWNHDLLEGRGFVLIRGYPVEQRSIAHAAAAFWGLGTHFGKACSQNAQGHLLGHVYDKGLSLDDPAVRVYQTHERQTFHTDSCDIVGLLCLQAAKSGGLSSLVSSMTIYNRMAVARPDLAQRLFGSFPTDRRGEVPPGKKPYFDIPVFNDFAGRLSAIYARRYIESSQRLDEARRLEPVDIEALDMLDALANDPDLRLDMTLQPGDMQFVHNHTILHDRTDYEDWPDPARKRHLLRLWLAAYEGRPLPDYYAERYGSVTIGDRGGIVCADTIRHIPLEP